MQFKDLDRISPEEFELTVKRWFESMKCALESFDAKHREIVAGIDGEYEIDVTLRFTVLGGASIFSIVECKKHKNPIKREVVQALHARKESLGAHKAILVSTSPFQDGARKYAELHGIALVQVVDGSLAFLQASAVPCKVRIPDDGDPFVGFYEIKTRDGNTLTMLVATDHPVELEQFLTAEDATHSSSVETPRKE